MPLLVTGIQSIDELQAVDKGPPMKSPLIINETNECGGRLKLIQVL